MELENRPCTTLVPSGKEGQPPLASPAPPALPFDLDKLKSPTLSSRELSILAIFGEALQPSSDTDRPDDPDAVEHACTQAAVALNTLCPPIDDTCDNYETSATVESFLWELWSLVLDIARSVPHDAQHPGQATLVGILDALHHLPRGTITLWGSDLQLWCDLPLFVQRVADSSGGPRSDRLSEEVIQCWRNQSALSARCLEAGLAGWDDYATYALRAALEEELMENNANIDCATLTMLQRCAVLAATEWVIYSSPKLLKLAQDSDEDHEDGVVYDRGDDDVPQGPLFKGRAGLSGARWAFWKERFQALLQPPWVLSEDVRAAVALSTERMERAETESTERAAEQLERWEREIVVEEAEAAEKEEKDDFADVGDDSEEEDDMNAEKNDEKKGNNEISKDKVEGKESMEGSD